MLHPNNFQVNEAWIAFRLNDAPIVTEAEGDFDVIALMDAASCFILGTVFVPATSLEPSEMEVKRLIKAGQSHKQQLPKALYIPTTLIVDNLSVEAERKGIAIVRIQEEQLQLFVGDAREGFKSHIGR